jgi:replicative DNA helicase
MTSNYTGISNSEESVLGSLMNDASCYSKVDLVPEDFSIELNRSIYRSIQALAKHGKPIDVVTVSESFGDLSITQECARIALNTPTSANVAAYSDNVKKAARIREAKRIAELLPAALDKHGNKAIERAVVALLKLSTDGRNWEFNLNDSLSDALEIIDEMEQTGGAIKIPTGLIDLDNLLGGWHPPDLTIIAARPAMGKTALLLNLARKCNVPCGLISAEQPREQIGLRYLSMESKVPLEAMRVAKLGPNDYGKVSDALADLNACTVLGYDKPAPSLSDVIRQARKWRYEFGIQVLFVDYLQLIRSENQQAPRHLQIAEIARGLKNIARDLSIPVVALAQLNRKLEERPNKRPMMSDLRDSGEIEQEADQIIMLYRDEVYDPASLDKGTMELNVVKNRHGQTGMVKASWIPEQLRVENLTPSWANYEGMASA